MALPSSCVNGSPSSTLLCSVCWDPLSASCGRTLVTLRCSHMFHLDCIGSAFNAAGIMQCPNCRVVENGEWRRFDNDQGPEADDEEDDFYVVADEVPRHFDTVPRNNRVLPAQARTGLPVIDEMSPSHGIRCPHPSCDCQFATNSMSAHIAGANHSSAPIIHPLNMRVGAPGIPNMEFISQLFSLDPVVATTSIGPMLGSEVYRNSQMAYNNVHWMQPHNNAPSQALQNMFAARNAMNGVQQPPSEQQTQGLNISSSMRVTFLGHLPPPMMFPPQTNEGHDIFPPEYWRDDMDHYMEDQE
ncbi:hypothetical protein Tsubulata_016275 [Turnera subulata]|uniref:RING-type domain-containing protein n=1 Tax=Turnera subulata TaxID=218843 RepID=A0A9Q0JAG2_9ROSI|nr:hypothetical protein Tsubulata_016275 [Turnera subulata]